MTLNKMYWINELVSFPEFREDIHQMTTLDNYKIGYKTKPMRLYIVSEESAEIVISQLHDAGYTVSEITNHD